MKDRIAETAQHLKPETVESLQELVHALRDSVEYHFKAAEMIDDDYVKSTFQEIAKERADICGLISGLIAMSDESPVLDGTFLGSLRNIWTSFRAAINSGDATVVLIEAERAEDVIVNKFKNVLPQIAGNPVNDRLLRYFAAVKSGHDRVLGLRNAYQNA